MGLDIGSHTIGVAISDELGADRSGVENSTDDRSKRGR